MKIFSRLMKSRRDSLVLSVRLTRRTATVTMSAPEAAWARAISWKLRYLPVPTMRREFKARPAITSWSDIGVSEGDCIPWGGWRTNGCGGVDRREEMRKDLTQRTQRSEHRVHRDEKRGAQAGVPVPPRRKNQEGGIKPPLHTVAQSKLVRTTG